MTHSSATVDAQKFVLSIRGLRIVARTIGSGDPVLCCCSTVPAGHDLQRPGPAALVAQLVDRFLDSETSVTG